MRQMISGLVAAIAVVGASAAPASACGLFQSTCGEAYVAPVYSGCNTGCGGGWAYERLPDPVQQYYPEAVHQYYFANQGPTYSGPGNFAPYPSYQESALPTYGYHPHYWGHPHMHYGYEHHGYGYEHHGYAPHHSMRYGYHGMPHQYGYHHEHTLRRYY
jgi:hypothetical protein